MRRQHWMVGDKALKPLEDEATGCWMCGNLHGTPHHDECSMRRKTIRMDVTVSVVVDVPERMSDGEITKQYNDGGWCADNIIEVLQEQSKRVKCLCKHARFSNIRDATEKDEKEFNYRVVDIKA